jgi:hypothetical protein
MGFRVAPELIVVVALDDLPTNADNPQRHRQPPGHPAHLYPRSSFVPSGCVTTAMAVTRPRATIGSARTTVTRQLDRPSLKAPAAPTPSPPPTAGTAPPRSRVCGLLDHGPPRPLPAPPPTPLPPQTSSLSGTAATHACATRTPAEEGDDRQARPHHPSTRPTLETRDASRQPRSPTSRPERHSTTVN